jgi:hypothetical protein
MVGQGSDLRYQSFNVFGAVALAGIGRVADTIADRSITVNLERLPAGEHVESFRHREVIETTTGLRRRLAAWSARHVDELGAARPEMPDKVTDRAADIWEPLLAVADIAGGRWPAAVRAAATHMVAAHLVEDSDATLPVRLLADIRTVWPESTDRALSRRLVEALNALDDSPWSDVRRGTGITMNWLANRLRPFGIESKRMRTGADNARGYEWDDFVAVWSQYGVSEEQLRSSRSGEPEPAEPLPRLEPTDVPSGPDGPDVPASQTQSEQVVVDASPNGDAPPIPGAVKSFHKARR